MQYSCLDGIKVCWITDTGDGRAECAIVLEVSESACVLHTTTALNPGKSITLKIDEDHQLPAEVIDLEQDDFGCYLSVRTTKPWFPDVYQPAYLLPLEQSSTRRAAPDRD